MLGTGERISDIRKRQSENADYMVPSWGVRLRRIAPREGKEQSKRREIPHCARLRRVRKDVWEVGGMKSF
jgi:hypothetical protein